MKLYAKHIGKTTEQIEEDIRRPKYFSPSEAVEYGIIDKVLEFFYIKINYKLFYLLFVVFVGYL